MVGEKNPIEMAWNDFDDTVYFTSWALKFVHAYMHGMILCT